MRLRHRSDPTQANVATFGPFPASDLLINAPRLRAGTSASTFNHSTNWLTAALDLSRGGIIKAQ